MAKEVAVLGVGMHPWGKWGKSFIEYGVVAARAALENAGLAWTDIQFVAGGDTMRNGYPGYVADPVFWNISNLKLRSAPIRRPRYVDPTTGVR